MHIGAHPTGTASTQHLGREHNTAHLALQQLAHKQHHPPGQHTGVCTCLSGVCVRACLLWVCVFVCKECIVTSLYTSLMHVTRLLAIHTVHVWMVCKVVHVCTCVLKGCARARVCFYLPELVPLSRPPG